MAGNGKRQDEAKAGHWLSREFWGNVFRLVYLFIVLLVTLPVIFYALAAYQYQEKAAAIAADQGRDAGQLMADVATLNAGMHDWAALVRRAANDADKRGTAPTPGTVTQQAATSEANTPAPVSTSSDTTLAPAVSNAEIVQVFQDSVRALQARRLSGDDLEPSAIGANATDTAGDSATLILATELHRFDRLSLPAWVPLYGRPSLLADLPGWALTLVVTLVAGLLGSHIYVLKTVLRQLLDNWSKPAARTRAPRPWSWLLLRPVFGVFVAVAAYVVLQSGLLVFDGAMSLSLNANVTAAVGLIAGLLSWQVIQTIEDVGERWLNRQRPLWGYGLKWHIAKAGSVAELAEKLEVSEAMLTDWINLRLPVPKHKTTKLATLLGVDPDELFQPVPPWQRGAPTPAES